MLDPPPRTSRFAAAGLTALLLLLVAAPATAQPANCGEYRGVTCQGFFTDEAGVVLDRQRIEAAIVRMVDTHGNPIVVVIVNDSRGDSPVDFAVALADDWGIGDPSEENGVLILVSLEERRTEVVTQSGMPIPGTIVSRTANGYFRDGDFEGGVLAMLGVLDQMLAGDFEAPQPRSFSPFGVGAFVLLGVVIVGAVVAGKVISGRRSRARAERGRRSRVVDGDLGALAPAGHELPRFADFEVPTPEPDSPGSTSLALEGLRRIRDGGPVRDEQVVRVLATSRLVVVVDRDRLESETREPLELRVSQERPLLESAVQDAADQALAVNWRDDMEFQVRRRELQRLIASLRPHRVAAAVRRTGDALLDELVRTASGYVAATADGVAFTEAGPGLDLDAPLVDSVAEFTDVTRLARDKANRLERLYESLPASTTRPAVAAALADADVSPESAVARYERVRRALEEQGSSLSAGGLDLAAIAALLVMNNSDDNVAEFTGAYTAHRNRGFDPPAAVEYALAGLTSMAEIDRIKAEADRLSLPISITAALLRRRDDGAEVYQDLLNELAAHVETESARTIAGVLAMSLEPTQALRLWLEAREALHDLGLRGSYADVAAAFGASDPRGPRRFALAYAAQRRALAASSIDDADRFAPELAHEGTSGQRDTWTGRPIPSDLRYFDPFTLFYYHWIITRGHTGSYGWERVYRDRSWSEDRSSWWGGGGGFGSRGGSSWGGSSSGGGSFGGFGGGGGFSGAGGSGW